MEYSRGDKIIQEGERGSVFYIIESGQVEITKLDENKKDKHIRYRRSFIRFSFCCSDHELASFTL